MRVTLDSPEEAKQEEAIAQEEVRIAQVAQPDLAAIVAKLQARLEEQNTLILTLQTQMTALQQEVLALRDQATTSQRHLAAAAAIPQAGLFGTHTTVEEHKKEKRALPPPVDIEKIKQIQSLLKKEVHNNIRSIVAQDPVLAASKELFFLYIAAGQQKQAEEMLAQHPELAIAKGTITNLAGRSAPKKMTAFQYAVFTLDTRMWKMFYDPDEPERAYLTSEQAAIQLSELNHACVDLKPLIDAYTAFIAETKSAVKNAEKYKIFWVKIGKEQIGIPTHIIQEFCQPRGQSFDPIPDFKNPLFERRIKCNQTSWFEKGEDNEEIGVNAAAYRGDCLYYAIITETPFPNIFASIELDLAALHTLYSVRSQERAELAAHLAPYLSQKSLDPQPAPQESVCAM